MSDVYSAIRADINNGRFTSLSWTDKDECASCGASKVHMGGSLPDAPVRWRLCWFCFMTNYRAKRERVAAPLPDFRGKPIHEGDFLFGSTNTDVIIG